MATLRDALRAEVHAQARRVLADARGFAPIDRGPLTRTAYKEGGIVTGPGAPPREQRRRDPLPSPRPRGTGRRRVDSMDPEPHVLMGDCPRCGEFGLHLLGRVSRHSLGFREILRECLGCGGRWEERLPDGD